MRYFFDTVENFFCRKTGWCGVAFLVRHSKWFEGWYFG